MDKKLNEPNAEPGFKPGLQYESRTDPTFMWFASAVLFAVLAAGVIIYRSGNSDFRTASMQVAAAPMAAHSGAAEIPPVYSHIEGVDP
jgi:hypothetical protein